MDSIFAQSGLLTHSTMGMAVVDTFRTESTMIEVCFTRVNVLACALVRYLEIIRSLVPGNWSREVGLC